MFFPHSYEKSYKSLLDTMMRSDLALKGNFDGVELLIFPSNHLPEKSQRKTIISNLLYVDCLFTYFGHKFKAIVVQSDLGAHLKVSPGRNCLCEAFFLEPCRVKFNR